MIVRTMRRRDGAALIEALVAIVLIAIAGAMVATAAAAGLRATHRAATLEHVTATAARQLAQLASRGAGAAGSDTIGSVPGIPGPVQQTTDVQRDGRMLALSASVEGGRPSESVTLATHVLLPP
jgi:type II secretory pathway pseudopilin PulG